MAKVKRGFGKGRPLWPPKGSNFEMGRHKATRTYFVAKGGRVIFEAQEKSSDSTDPFEIKSAITTSTQPPIRLKECPPCSTTKCLLFGNFFAASSPSVEELQDPDLLKSKERLLSIHTFCFEQVVSLLAKQYRRWRFA